MNRRTFSAAIAAFFGLGLVAKAEPDVQPIYDFTDGTAAVWSRAERDAYLEMLEANRIKIGQVIHIGRDETLTGFNP